SIEEKVAMLLRINEEALKVKGASFCTSAMQIANEHKIFASTEGSYIEQDLIRMSPSFTVTAVDKATGKFESRSSFVAPVGKGYECIEEKSLLVEARQAAEEAVAKHSATPIVPGKHDNILHPTNLRL